MENNKQIARFIGTITWIEGDIMNQNPGGAHYTAKIIRGIKVKNGFNIEYGPNDDDDGGLIKLTTTDGFSYEGGLFYDTDRTSHASVQLKYYENNSKALLIGKWVQSTYVFTAILRLEAVAEFTG